MLFWLKYSKENCQLLLNCTVNTRIIFAPTVYDKKYSLSLILVKRGRLKVKLYRYVFVTSLRIRIIK